MEEVAYIMSIYKKFRCQILAHDFGGSGAVRETLLVQAGLPVQSIMPILYTGVSSKNFIIHNPPSEGSTRHFWSVDKSRSLVTTCMSIKLGFIMLPEYESAKELTSDFLALIEDKMDRPGYSDIYRITRQPKLRDDFAHSVNYAAIANWHSNNSWPNLGNALSAYELGDDIIRDF